MIVDVCIRGWGVVMMMMMVVGCSKMVVVVVVRMAVTGVGGNIPGWGGGLTNPGADGCGMRAGRRQVPKGKKWFDGVG